jgi:hypothetical protein
VLFSEFRILLREDKEVNDDPRATMGARGKQRADGIQLQHEQHHIAQPLAGGQLNQKILNFNRDPHQEATDEEDQLSIG